MKWLTTTQVGKRIGRSSRAVRNLLDHEKFEYFKGAYRVPGGGWRIPAESVEVFLENMQAAARRVRRGKSGKVTNEQP